MVIGFFDEPSLSIFVLPFVKDPDSLSEKKIPDPVSRFTLFQAFTSLN